MIFHGPKDPVYTISVAARLLGVGAQFLRQVENEGLVAPARTDSNIRLYSDEDLKLLSRIVYLCRERGVNLQGVRVILAMEDGEREDTKERREKQGGKPNSRGRPDTDDFGGGQRPGSRSQT